MRSFPHIDFDRNAREALGNDFLQRALRSAMVRFRELQAPVIAEVPQWQALREYAHDVKMHTLGRLDRYLQQLEQEVSARGGRVHWARDGAEAATIIARLARGRYVVKSKSMTSEEIHLNESLERAGCEVTEGDLGEYLIQLAGEAPSHIIAPVVHRSKESIAELLSAAAGTPLPAEPEVLTGAARRLLRERFLRADVGITGVNFAVAETGTIVVVENEGNIRLTTSLPRIHIALMGIEKVIPRLADLAVFLTLLPRAATGQRMSSYVSFITGPRREGEADGPEEFHLVVMDNGRVRIQADVEMRESLACIRCGACLDVCPVFERTGGHAYGSEYSGPIGAVITPLYRGLRAAGDLPFASSLCGACGEVCPVKIDLPRLLLELRARVVRERGAAWSERLFVRMWTAVMKHPARLRLAGKAARVLHRLAARRMLPLPYPFSRWTVSRDLPAPPARAFRDGRPR
ncbi:MAG TPA: LutB/LldF family L-lactate oxidation iron-sulfur protein [bacterium]|nr:LutB/LldF family L-lactate oxidation iron-sulfur protein [bacterium]